MKADKVEELFDQHYARAQEELCSDGWISRDWMHVAAHALVKAVLEEAKLKEIEAINALNIEREEADAAYEKRVDQALNFERENSHAVGFQDGYREGKK